MSKQKSKKTVVLKLKCGHKTRPLSARHIDRLYPPGTIWCSKCQARVKTT